MANEIFAWGSINANGTKASGHGFDVVKIDNGQYSIAFTPEFKEIPAIVGSQTRFGSIVQSTLDNVIFPLVDRAQATVLTGDAHGNREDRNFSFIAIGH